MEDSMKTAYVFLAEGFEEVEALTPVDYLRRAGIDVRTVSMSEGKTVTGARKISVVADILFKDMPPSFDCVVLPGGMPGSKNLAAHSGLVALVRDAMSRGALVGAICAAPALVLGKAANVLDGRRFTCFPGMEDDAGGQGSFSDERVVIDGNLITSRAAGTAGEFALALVKALSGPRSASDVSESVLLGRSA
jgi:4-methyl-5(b-hydroxyethyl)-thiazole monophosphate biosynthesis